MSKIKQHWLPRVYLRPFKAHEDKETVFVFDLLEKPCWREVGFNDIGYSRSYHFSAKADIEIDRITLNGYAAIISKLSRIQKSIALPEVLEEDEVDHLIFFLHAHRIRNPLISYHWAFGVLHEYLT